MLRSASRQLRFVDQGRRLLGYEDSGSQAWLCDTRTWKMDLETRCQGGYFVDVTPDGRWFAVGDQDTDEKGRCQRSLVTVYASDGSRRIRLAIEGRCLNELQLSPDGEHLVVAWRAGDFRLYRTGDGGFRDYPPGREGFSPDGKLLASRTALQYPAAVYPK